MLHMIYAVAPFSSTGELVEDNLNGFELSPTLKNVSETVGL